MVVDIADELFPDVLEGLKYSWITLIEFHRIDAGVWQSILAFVTLLFHVLIHIVLLALRAGIAASLGIINVVVWVAVVFSTAAPMILSGLYEASTDRQVLHAIERKVRLLKVKHVKDRRQPANDVKKITYQVHMLYAVLVGNLELWKPPGGDEDVEKAAGGHNKALGDGKNIDKAADGRSKELGDGKKGVVKAADGRSKELGVAWDHVEQLVATLGDGTDEESRKATETRLQTMLQCQASFGATIGAPIAFFLGSFLFSVFSNYETVGDNNTAHALAFGEWWMTIPHIAIVGGCLLAGNNPNTLEAIVSGLPRDPNDKSRSPPTDEDEKEDQRRSRRIAHGLRRSYTYFYKSIYQPVWMWERGRSKRSWLVEVQKVHTKAQDSSAQAAAEAESPPPPPPQVARKKPSMLRSLVGSLMEYVRKFYYAWGEVHPLEKVPDLGHFAWTTLGLTASILVILPWVLAYVTSYYTPTIGLSCRTFTFVLYFLFQLVLTAIWFYDFRYERPVPRRDPITGWPTTFGIVLFLAFIGSAFTAVIGTFLQIVGVYRNCKCSTPMNSWSNGRFSFAISTNSAEKIYYANLYWLGGGVASIVLLIFFCYLGWWYQRHWRQRFDKVVKDVLMTNTEKELKQLARKMELDDKIRERALIRAQTGDNHAGAQGSSEKNIMTGAAQPVAAS